MAPKREVTGMQYDPRIKPARTPGPLGINDAADPSSLAYLGDTPGPLGFSDSGDPSFQLDHFFQKERTWALAAHVSPLGLNTERPGTEKPSYRIPAPKTASPPLLSDSEIVDAAIALGVEPAVIYAVSKVESGGRTGFDKKGRPKILFEARWFHKFTFGRYDKSYPSLSQPTWEGARQFYRQDQWLRLEAGFGLDKKAALSSASWGKFQIMGFNHSGFANVFDFCDAMFISEAEHLQSFLSFCKERNLISHLRRKEWSMFARSYNGAGYKQNKYDVKLRKAYEEYKNREVEEPIWI